MVIFFSFLLAFTLLLLTFTFRNLYPILFRKTLTFILILLSVIIILFISFSFNWITERTNIIGASVFLFTTLWWLYKENYFETEDILHPYDIEQAEAEVARLENRAQKTYEVYLKINESSRIALIELQELKKRKNN